MLRITVGLESSLDDHRQAAGARCSGRAFSALPGPLKPSASTWSSLSSVHGWTSFRTGPWPGTSAAEPATFTVHPASNIAPTTTGSSHPARIRTSRSARTLLGRTAAHLAYAESALGLQHFVAADERAQRLGHAHG